MVKLKKIVYIILKMRILRDKGTTLAVTTNCNLTFFAEKLFELKEIKDPKEHKEIKFIKYKIEDF